MAWPSIDLAGKVAMVTGGTRGLGRAIAEGLARAGADVAVSSRHGNESEAAASTLAAAYGVRALGLAADVRSPASAGAAVQATVSGLGHLDILVNNAGIGITRWALDLTEEEWDTVVGTNLKGVFFMAQAAARVMKDQGGGVIVNVSSVMGSVGDKMIAPYAAAKGGVDSLTRSLALEWIRYGIRVAGIAPAYVLTELNAERMQDERFMQGRLSHTPIRRFADPEEIAAAVTYLASGYAGYVVGSTMAIDGGWLAK